MLINCEGKEVISDFIFSYWRVVEMRVVYKIVKVLFVYVGFRITLVRVPCENMGLPYDSIVDVKRERLSDAVFPHSYYAWKGS